MKANDLRIGNLVNYLIIDEMDERKKWFEVSEIDYDDLRIIQNKHEVNQDYQPIQLTEEWLLKFGFFVENFDYSIPISDCEVVWLTLIPQDEECTAYSVCVTQTDEDELDQNVFLSDISYVHQLQNLYYALTNKELIIQ
jgi:hypothetical protein